MAALPLAALVALLALAWIAWETVAHALTFDRTFANGPFQLLNPLRRLAEGQHIGADFLVFHGPGAIWAHWPIFALFGGDLRATELTRFMTGALLHLVAAVALGHAFLGGAGRKPERHLFILLFFAAGVLLLYRSVMPATSNIGVRSIFPLLVAAALALPRGFRWAAPALAAALLTSIENGIAALLAALVAAVVLAVTRHGGARALAGAAIGGAALALLVLWVAAGTAGAAAMLRYAFIDVPGDQFWYFGAPPNPAIPREWPSLRQEWGFIVYAGLLGLGLAALWPINRAAPRLIGPALFLLGYAALGSVSQLGYFFAGNLHGAGRAAFAVLLLGGLLLATRERRALAALAIGGALLVTGVRTAQERPPVPLHATPGYLAPGWAAHVAAVERHDPGGTLWSVYAGLPEARRGVFHPSFDYIIHALGTAHRAAYLEAFRTTRPGLVRLDPPDWDFAPWLLMHNWPFYREVFHNYAPVQADAYGSLWLPLSVPTEPRPPRALGAPDAAGCLVVPDAGPTGLLTAEISFRLHDPWGWLPLLGRTTRAMVHIQGAAAARFTRVALPSVPAYGGRMELPLVLEPGGTARLCPVVATFFPGVRLEFAGGRVAEEGFLPAIRRHILTGNGEAGR